VHSLIENQAKIRPDSIATQFEDYRDVTYDDLNGTANMVAKQLVCGRGTIVPIAASRSINMVIALLAVLKTGAAYTLLSADSPIDRNQYIVKDTKAPFIIVDDTTRGNFDGTKEILIEDLVAQTLIMDAKHRNNLDIYQASSDLAYIIYTSGTTGTPKGVMLSHAAAYTGLCALPALDPSQPLRQLLCHSPNFSAAQRTILGTLSRGGTLCLASKENITLQLHDTVEQMAVSSLEITPSMLKLIDLSAIPQSIKKITLGGEPVGPALVEAWAGKVELVSAYGLSEVTQLNLRHQLKLGQSSRTIGKPTDSTTYFVLEPGTLNLAAPNSPGELCLGGGQLAEGYLNLPEKTNEVFVVNPFGSGRLYRTGDMVTANEDGTIDLIGRIDQQTKIDGQRVEPNESNSIIQVQPGVIMSCVVSGFVLNRKALVALVVPESDRDWPTLVRELRAKLRTQLPSYAIPRYWVQKDTLPLNVSGKVDIASLVKMVEAMDDSQLVTPSNSSPSSPSLTPPRGSPEPQATDVFEFKVMQAVAEVLSLSMAAIDLGSSFQELGGTSLDAIVFAAKLRKEDIHISVPDILQANTIRDMTALSTEQSVAVVAPPVPFSLLPENYKLKRNGLEDAYPVTPLQEGVLADSLLGNANYVYQRVYKLQGVTPAQVKSAIETVLARNSILRTTFRPFKRSFLQVVKPTTRLPWKLVKGKSLESYMEESLEEEMSIDEPLVRAAVLDNDLLVLEMHHGLFDFWSSQFVLADAVAVLQGNEPIPRQPFNSYVAFQQAAFNEGAKDFWKSYLGGASSTVVELSKTATGEPFVLTSDLGDSLFTLTSSQGVTMGTVLHAAWALALGRLIKSSDVTFMTAFSGRDADIDGILALNGPTLCTVPMRVQIDASASAIDFTKAVQGNLWNLSKYAHTGTRNALAVSGTKPDALNTMVNLLVKLQEFPEDSPLKPVFTHGDNFTQYITIELSEVDPSSVKMLVPFSADREQAQNMLDTFVEIIRSMAAEPDASISQMEAPKPVIAQSIVPAETAKQSFGLAHAAFEHFAAATPSKAAITTSAGRVLTYAELNAKANSFAHWLIRNGVQHEEMIPLYMEKSAETLISIIGILKAGASFTPMDPKNPHDRNAFIVKDVQAKRVVTDNKNSEACRAFGAELVIIENMDLSGNGDKNPYIPELTPASVIYAIYTSGSTGLPKGVLVQHSAVTASTEGMIEATAVTSEWNALWVLNYVFDASYYDVFTIFSAGATLCLAPQDELLSDLAGFINRMGVEQVMLTPTITKLINGGPSQVPHVKVLNVCGERIDVNILEWAQKVDVYNGYGPTEATILMTVSKVEPDGSLNSIGFPLKHAYAAILPPDGSSLERVPHGTIGELCVRGPHLAKGYLNRPEQTTAAFIRDTDGEPLYRTGDLARWADDGTLECLGRKDYQVKLNGFRIELGEIENAILTTGEADAAVVSVAEVNGKRQLVAFTIFKGDHKPGNNSPLPPQERIGMVAQLMSKLTTISHYMMPALFLPFQSFPTLPSGKANRKELVALVEKMQKSEITQYIPIDENAEEFKPVETDQERIMQEAWANVLGEDEDDIGANSVFLSLGGDSISAINVVSECRKIGYNISVSHILSNPTLAEQAKHLVPAKAKKVAVDVKYDVPATILTALGNAGISVDERVEEIYPAGPGQIEFLTQGHKEHQFWNLTACRELPADFDLEQWKHVTEKLTARNQIMRAGYFQADAEDESSWWNIIYKDSALNFELIHYSGEKEKLRYMEELRDSLFTFGKPNIKYRVLQSLTDGTRTLCIKVDHGTYDGTLLRIFDEQFLALARGETSLPPVNSFKKFVDWSSSVDRADALAYWTDSLSTYTPAHNLPHQPIADRLRMAPVTADVDAVATKYGVTASTVFQAAYSLVAGRLAGTTDTLVDNLLTGRNADVEDPNSLNGTCANFLPFRAQLVPTQSISTFLKDTQNTFWDTTEAGTVGKHDIYKALTRDRHTHGAKIMYCFQPFDPAPATAKPNPMRWIVMAQSKVFMTINYALMVEVQRTTGGHRFKLQWDSRALQDGQVGEMVKLFDDVIDEMAR
ncbi:acetyl-CoA synthetase-like protein, partial [Saccharata proteae CBS 121410]